MREFPPCPVPGRYAHGSDMLIALFGRFLEALGTRQG